MVRVRDTKDSQRVQGCVYTIEVELWQAGEDISITIEFTVDRTEASKWLLDQLEYQRSLEELRQVFRTITGDRTPRSIERQTPLINTPTPDPKLRSKIAAHFFPIATFVPVRNVEASNWDGTDLIEVPTPREGVEPSCNP